MVKFLYVIALLNLIIASYMVVNIALKMKQKLKLLSELDDNTIYKWRIY